MKLNHRLKPWFVAAALLAAPALLPAQVAVDPAVLENLQKQVKTLNEEVARLKEGAPRDPAADELMGRKFFNSQNLRIGFYGESKYRMPLQGSGATGNNRFDPHRFVLTPSYVIADWLIFNSEIEIEHGAVDESVNSGRNRFDGELEIEQVYVDILINEHFNIRSPGLDLVPVGRINKQHEPTLFYSTERPELYREIIPSTWVEPSLSFFGKIVENLDYQLMISTGLEDAIPTAGSAATSTRPAGFAGPGIDGIGGMRNGRPRYRAASENSLAWSGRLHYNGIRGLDTSASFYVTKAKGLTGDSTLALFNYEALYRVPGTGLELRGDVAYWNISSPEHLVANNNTSGGDDLGGRMYGWHVEAAYHFWPADWKTGKGKDMDLVPFIRYTDIVTQSGLLAGSAATNDGTRNKTFLTAGLAYFLNANFVLKADYRRNLSRSAASHLDANAQDYFQFGAGIFF